MKLSKRYRGSATAQAPETGSNCGSKKEEFPSQPSCSSQFELDCSTELLVTTVGKRRKKRGAVSQLFASLGFAAVGALKPLVSYYPQSSLLGLEQTACHAIRSSSSTVVPLLVKRHFPVLDFCCYSTTENLGCCEQYQAILLWRSGQNQAQERQAENQWRPIHSTSSWRHRR